MVEVDHFRHPQGSRNFTVKSLRGWFDKSKVPLSLISMLRTGRRRPSRDYFSGDHRITSEDGRLYFTVNGAKIPAEDVKFLEPARLAEVCNLASEQIHEGHPGIRLSDSIAPPKARPRPFAVQANGVIRNLYLAEPAHASA